MTFSDIARFQAGCAQYMSDVELDLCRTTSSERNHGTMAMDGSSCTIRVPRYLPPTQLFPAFALDLAANITLIYSDAHSLLLTSFSRMSSSAHRQATGCRK